MKVYFHLGMHKTGSSLLQQRIFPKMKNVYYVPRNDSSELKKYIQYTDDFEFDPSTGKEIFYNIRNVNKSNIVLISDEEFYGNPYWSNMDRKRNIDRIIAIFGEEVGFILFIRNQFSLINSLYNQYVKTGGTADFDSFLNFKKFPLYVSTEYFCFDKYVKYIHSKVGQDNFKLYLFEEFLQNKEVVVKEIFSFLGSEYVDFEEKDFSMTNPSLNNNFVPILRYLNKFTKSPKNPFHLLHYYVQIAFRKFFLKLNNLPLKEKKFQFKNQKTVSMLKVSNQNLQKSFDLNLEKYNYPM